MKLITGLEPQPQFPRKDLTKVNAEMLELMLSNMEIIDQSHRGAEGISWVYKAGHPAIRKAGGRVISNSGYVRALDHGVSTYEAIAGLVQSAPNRCDTFTVNTNAVALVNAMSEDKVTEYMDGARYKFDKEMPLTAEVILESSERFYRGMGRYVLFGAAVARQFELDAA